jgi:hypothetical protein
MRELSCLGQGFAYVAAHLLERLKSIVIFSRAKW